MSRKNIRETILGMNKKTKTLFLIFIFSFLVRNMWAAECKVTVLHFNDLHGYLEAPSKKVGGATRIAALIGKIEKENDEKGGHTILVVGGDVLSGTRVSEDFKGEAEFEFLKAIGVEAVVIGNHEFDFGKEALRKNIQRLDVPVLGANIIDAKLKRNFATASFILPLGPDCRVGILGLTTDTTPLSTLPSNVEELVFKDPVKYAEFYIDDLAEQSEIRLALVHMEREKDIELAKRVKGFDLVVGGHNHVSSDAYCMNENGIPLCETPSKGRYLGRIDIRHSNGKTVVENSELIPVNSKAGRSKDIENLLKPYLRAVKLRDNEVIGSLRDVLPSTSEDDLHIPLIQFVARIIKETLGAEVGVVNRGDIRKTLRGKVTGNDLFEALPFKNEIGTLDLTGNELLEIITRSERKTNSYHLNPYLNWSGLDYVRTGDTYEVIVNGEPLDRGRTYKVATIEYLAEGGDGYSVFGRNQFNRSGNFQREAVADYIRNSR